MKGDGAHRLALIRSYALDWLSIIFLLVTALLLTTQVPTLIRPFRLDDPSIAAPWNQSETVPTWLLGVLSILVPFMLQTLVALGVRRDLHDWHHATLGLSLSLVLTLLITFLTKNMIGELRPSFLARCQPSSDIAIRKASLTVLGGVHWYTEAVCTGDPAAILEGRKSFFSGHTSLSFAGLAFFAFYLGGKLHVFDRTGRVARFVLALWPLVLALFIGLSRLHDQWHFWQDVLVGMLVGIGTARLAYRLYYPPLHDPLCDEPYRDRLVALSLHGHPSTQASFFPRRHRGVTDIDLRPHTAAVHDQTIEANHFHYETDTWRGASSWDSVALVTSQPRAPGPSKAPTIKTDYSRPYPLNMTLTSVMVSSP